MLSPCRTFGKAVQKGCGLSSEPYTAFYTLDPAQTYVLIIIQFDFVNTAYICISVISFLL